MLKAKDVMKTEVIAVSPDATVKEIARIMDTHDISGIPVVTKYREILGVVSENDMIEKSVKPNEPGLATFMINAVFGSSEISEYRKSLRRFRAKTAKDIMTSPAICVGIDDSLEKAGQIMLEKKIKRVFVTEDGNHLAGVISRSIFVRLLVEDQTDEEK